MATVGVSQRSPVLSSSPQHACPSNFGFHQSARQLLWCLIRRTCRERSSSRAWSSASMALFSQSVPSTNTSNSRKLSESGLQNTGTIRGILDTQWVSCAIFRHKPELSRSSLWLASMPCTWFLSQLEASTIAWLAILNWRSSSVYHYLIKSFQWVLWTVLILALTESNLLVILWSWNF